MKKTPSLYLRDFDSPGNPLTRTPNPEADWVFDDYGVATRKYDGSCCYIGNRILLGETGKWLENADRHERKIFARYDAKHGKTPPPGWIPAQPEPDPVTGHHPGWRDCEDDPAQYKWFLDTFRKEPNAQLLTPGTYELVGPKVNGNPEHLKRMTLIRHESADRFYGVPTDFDALKEWLKDKDIEGIVWQNIMDGKFVKIKKSDFGLERKPNASSSR